MSSRFITYPIPIDARDLIAKAFQYMQAKNPNWEPSEGQPDVWIIESQGSEAADIGTLASQVPKSIFGTYGQQLFGIPPLDTIAATVSVNIYATDALGHSIPAGTQLTIPDSLGNPVGFRTLAEAVIPNGQTHVDNVLCVATVGGAAGSNLGSVGGVVSLLDAGTLTFIDHISQVAVTTGGQDAESDDDYLDRLSIELQTMSPRPILAEDFSILARNVAKVQRATTLDGYNPADDTLGNERMVCVFSLDASGAGVDALTEAAVQSYLDGLRELNFIVNTDDPTENDIDVNTHFTVFPDYDLTDVQSRVSTAIQNFLDPKIWGIFRSDNPNNPKTWSNQNIVYYLELATAINEVPGVNFITSLILGASGGALAAADYNMTGRVPIPNAVTITVVGSYT